MCPPVSRLSCRRSIPVAARTADYTQAVAHIAGCSPAAAEEGHTAGHSHGVKEEGHIRRARGHSQTHSSPAEEAAAAVLGW
jgi:hypothetical protein